MAHADAGYTSDDYNKGTWHLGLSWCADDKRKPGKNLSSRQHKRNRKSSSVRVRVEHIFRIIKCQFGFRKTRYQSWRKTPTKWNWLVGLANLYLQFMAT